MSTTFTEPLAALGISTVAAVVPWLQALPYGRVDGPLDVVHEARGTCSTKHAALVAFARERGHDAHLLLGYFEMTGETAPGVGEALRRHGVDAVLEAHCLALVDGEPVDVTFPDGRTSPPLTDRRRLPLASLDLKPRLHREAIARWATQRGLDAETIWRAREAAIADLARGHTVLVGATGMLRPLARALARTSRVTMLARRPHPAPAEGDAWLGVPTDWTEPDSLCGAMRRLHGLRGPPDRVVAWVHADGFPALEALGRTLPDTTRVVHVRGSAAARPGAAPSVLGEHPGSREVVLGYVPGPHGSRWLTNDEIVTAVHEALVAPASETRRRWIAGVVDPWDPP